MRDTSAPNAKRAPREPAPRPRDAGTLVLVRQGRRGPEVLMGERSAAHVFVPHHYVFPGGRVDRADSRVRPLTPLRPEVEARLVKSCSPARARALALAAVRETFEETGLALGRALAAPPASVPESWRAFYATGVGPALDTIDYIARAVTPPGRPRRFHARFFLADASLARGTLRGNGELLNLAWLPIEEALGLKLRSITAWVLQGLLEDPKANEGVPVYKTLRGKRSLSFD